MHGPEKKKKKILFIEQRVNQGETSRLEVKAV